MIRAIFFDFFTVWTPDKFSYYLAMAQQVGPEVFKELSDAVERYYQGEADINYIANLFSIRLNLPTLSPELFKLEDTDISPEIINFMRHLHGHFVKIGVLANLGTQEYQLLNSFNERNQLLEVIASPLSLGIKLPLHSKEVFVQALQAIGEPPRSCLIVSGDPYYLEFAASLELATLQFEGLAKLQQDLDQLLQSDLPQA